jgi:hypothetical protein
LQRLRMLCRCRAVGRNASTACASR